MSRQELAEAINAYLYEHAGRMSAIHARYIGTLERGQTRWPSAHYRMALRAVLGRATDAELGFFVIQGHANDPDVNQVELAAPSEASDAAPTGFLAGVPPVVSAAPEDALAGAVGGGFPVELACVAVVQVRAIPGEAVTVVCHDGSSGSVAVVAGPVQVLIDTCGTEPATRGLAAAGAPVADGAQAYSIVDRWAR
ncbi:hypothetical protein ACIG87_02660 [Micromonospora sp. NPDC051925]|uniref:hypothetical protein n=1 Tax=Micromonospora sp. NPDC051925 TaxID=3364288 RepID=UPI0037C83625